MKKLFHLTFLLSTLVPLSNFAQAPQSFKYQAILREASGALLPNRPVSLRISILKTAIEGAVVYSESHKTTTTETGAINLEIGNGTTLSGGFSEIDWASDSHFVKIEVDKNGGSAFEQVGITQLLSVPYALYAEKSGDHNWENVANGISYNKGFVGIGTANPVHNLDIQSLNQTLGIYKSHFKGTESDGKGRLEIKSDPNDQGFQFLTSLNRIGDPSEDLILGLQHPIGNTTSWGIFESWRGAGLMVSSSGPDLNPLTFGIDRVEKMRLTNEGYLGIGTVNPLARLQVEDGDIYINDINSGVIMKSPNGQCWRMTVDNSGNPIFTLISCP